MCARTRMRQLPLAPPWGDFIAFNSRQWQFFVSIVRIGLALHTIAALGQAIRAALAACGCVGPRPTARCRPRLCLYLYLYYYVSLCSLAPHDFCPPPAGLMFLWASPPLHTDSRAHAFASLSALSLCGSELCPYTCTTLHFPDRMVTMAYICSQVFTSLSCRNPQPVVCSSGTQGDGTTNKSCANFHGTVFQTTGAHVRRVHVQGYMQNQFTPCYT